MWVVEGVDVVCELYLFVVLVVGFFEVWVIVNGEIICGLVVVLPLWFFGTCLYVVLNFFSVSMTLLFCFGFVLVLLYHMCIIFRYFFEIVLWSYLLGWRMRGWFYMVFLWGLFDGECLICGGDMYFVFSL